MPLTLRGLVIHGALVEELSPVPLCHDRRGQVEDDDLHRGVSCRKPASHHTAHHIPACRRPRQFVTEPKTWYPAAAPSGILPPCSELSSPWEPVMATDTLFTNHNKKILSLALCEGNPSMWPMDSLHKVPLKVSISRRHHGWPGTCLPCKSVPGRTCWILWWLHYQVFCSICVSWGCRSYLPRIYLPVYIRPRPGFRRTLVPSDGGWTPSRGDWIRRPRFRKRGWPIGRNSCHITTPKTQ